MSQSSTQSRGVDRRIDSLQKDGRVSRDSSRPRKKSVSYNDAYLYALRIAYLSYLLQPRSKRSRMVADPRPQITRSSSSFNDLMKDFSIVRDSKSTRSPHGFIVEVEKRLTGVLMGKEKRPEFHDSVVKRTFAVFLNRLSEQSFKKRMEKDRRVEDLVALFFSDATKELQKGKPPGDDGVKMMVDRHVALFVRLLSLVLKDNDWSKEKPELVTRLSTLETKLLAHDQDLSSTNGPGAGSMVEEIVPLSYEVKDMPLVQVVGRIFGLRNTMLQSDLDKHRQLWTEKAALQDLKTYQTHLNLGTRKTLSSQDFDLAEAYESWKRAEAPELSQMMLAIMKANPDLAKTTVGSNLPQFHGQANGISASDSGYSEISRALSLHSEEPSSFSMDQPFDLASLNLNDDKSFDHVDNSENVFTFIPPDPRATYRFVLSLALTWDLKDGNRDAAPAVSKPPPPSLLSKSSTELLNELATRWRIPVFSRAVLFLDVVREKYAEQEISLDALDGAFVYVKQAPDDNKRSSIVSPSALSERDKWTIADFALMRQLLSSLHDLLLRELYNSLMHCYDPKPPPLLSPILYILGAHIQNDPGFSMNPEEYNRFRISATEGLANKAREMYGVYLDEIPQDQDAWEFYHVTELGKTVLKLAERIQKRYKKNPEVYGVNLLIILIENTLPSYAEDARVMIERIIQAARDKGEEIPLQDGFDLYKEMTEFRRVHADALPGKPFPFNVEELLADFVWRWIRISEGQIIGWVENAIKHDNFAVRTEKPEQIPTEDERHSVSVIDIFRSFNQLIEQVVQLNWDDDVGYAKFMTSLSKAIGNGIARYCEIVEQMFAKEMDRLSPEQEAAARQTRQEKWMQLAKDTWNNKEKIEPFQFYAQSFVKLNDIAFALNQWDKLEREINADACAEVLQKVAPPLAQRQRKVTNYVFTIKIVEAEDLKACDVSGYSDPYVVLTDEYQKRLYKTRIIYQNLNPRWDESVDITTQGSLNVIATIWDWDTLGDHDYVGRTSLKLDPSHFGDFHPREYWFDLDTQGRVLVRVSMEGERDDIQFYFGKAFRTLKRTERDMTRKITDKVRKDS